MLAKTLLHDEIQAEARAALGRAQAELRFALQALGAAGVSTALLDALLHAGQTLDTAALVADAS